MTTQCFSRRKMKNVLKKSVKVVSKQKLKNKESSNQAFISEMD
jgi:hypothetical protein